MSIVTTMTTEQLLSIPDDGIERDLIRGELREWTQEKTMTKRNRFHTFVVTRIARILDQWLDSQPFPCGEAHTGEVGVAGKKCTVSRLAS
jgi:hypothetical protein